MKTLLILFGLYAFLFPDYPTNNQIIETSRLEIEIFFCNDAYREYFGEEMKVSIIHLVDAKGKRYNMESDTSPSTTFFINDLPFGVYHVLYKNLKGIKISVPIEIKETEQKIDLCIEEGIEWQTPNLLTTLENEEVLELIFEGVGGTYTYEKVLIEKKDSVWYLQYFKLERDYAIPKEENKTHFENLAFKTAAKGSETITLTEEKFNWLTGLETVTRLINSRNSCSMSEERYYFVKNGELLLEVQNGFCIRISPWGKLVTKFFR